MTSTLPLPAVLPDTETLHALYHPRIFRCLLASTRDRDLAQTLTQETFTRAWSARAQFRGDCAPPHLARRERSAEPCKIHHHPKHASPAAQSTFK